MNNGVNIELYTVVSANRKVLPNTLYILHHDVNVCAVLLSIFARSIPIKCEYCEWIAEAQNEMIV